jgi:hypothetical protein
MMVVSTMAMLAPTFDGYSYEQYWQPNVPLLARSADRGGILHCGE